MNLQLWRKLRRGTLMVRPRRFSRVTAVLVTCVTAAWAGRPLVGSSNSQVSPTSGVLDGMSFFYTELFTDRSFNRSRAMSNTHQTLSLSSDNPSLKAVFIPEEDKVVFSGSTFGNGSHALRLSVSSRERIVKHWEGFCEINNAKPIVKDRVGGLKVGSTVSFYARMRDRAGRVKAIDVEKGEALVLCEMEQYSGTCRYFEYYVFKVYAETPKDGWTKYSYEWVRRHTPAKLPKRWQNKLKSMAVDRILCLEKWDRYDGWVPASTMPKGRKRRTPVRWVARNRT